MRACSRAVALALATLLVGSLLCGCAGYASPRPWEKGELAKPAMQFDTDALDAKLEQHIYTSKEGAAGGSGVGGGGCGCN